MKRKILIFILITLVVVGIVLIGWQGGLVPSKNLPSPTPTAKTNRSNSQGDTLLYEESGFEISHLSSTQEYIIFINSAPFETYRKSAEIKLLNLLNITQEQACAKKVVVVSPPKINPDIEQTSFRLSFCKDLAPAPPSINPSLANLTIASFVPPPGQIAVGGTTDPLTVDFDQLVDLNTVVVESTPNMAFRISRHLVKPSSVVLTPQSKWQTGNKYEITVREGVTSQTKTSQLKSAVKSSFEITDFIFYDEGLPEGGI